MKTHDLTYIAVCTALIAICSWISIPTTVPFTLQLFGVFFAVGLLGGKNGTFSVLVYILLGTVGLPVFAGFTSGFGVIAGPLGGFIIGFLIAALVMWSIEAIFGRKKQVVLISMFVGLSLCYLVGTIRFISFYNTQHSAISVTSAIAICVLPYIIPDIIKLVMANVLSTQVRKLLKTDYR